MLEKKTQPNGEYGLSKEEFRMSEEELKRKIEIELGERFEKKARLYFEFANTEQRDRAMNYINRTREERREFDERFLYFEGCSVDSGRNAGIEIRFSKNPEHIREEFGKLLIEQGLAPKEEYKTVNGDPEPWETRINH
ncbi:MAG: hypothetical protein AAB902_01340 [Patescibacteria group bacterium]